MEMQLLLVELVSQFDLGLVTSHTVEPEPTPHL